MRGERLGADRTCGADRTLGARRDVDRETFGVLLRLGDERTVGVDRRVARLELRAGAERTRDVLRDGVERTLGVERVARLGLRDGADITRDELRLGADRTPEDEREDDEREEGVRLTRELLRVGARVVRERFDDGAR